MLFFSYNGLLDLENYQEFRKKVLPYTNSLLQPKILFKSITTVTPVKHERTFQRNNKAAKLFDFSMTIKNPEIVINLTEFPHFEIKQQNVSMY